jgi:NAD(P)-dependent dehydrogenase (short-subunit alcohol dehydrogenase family)
MLAGVADLHAVVTGGGRGIGAAIAATLKKHDARVTILGRDITALSAVVAAGAADAYFAVDITDEAVLQGCLAKVMVDIGPVDILVNNAGAAATSPFLKSSNADFRAMLEVNLLGAVTASRALLPGMIARKFGRIINIASTAGLKGYPYVSAYVTAKHALMGFTRALASETAQKGITVNAVCPGFTDTDMVARSIDTIVQKTGRTPEAARAELTRGNPQGRLVTPSEVAETVYFLARRESAAVTGAALPVAGGEI